MSNLATLIGQVARLSTGDLLALNAFTSELCRQRQAQPVSAPKGRKGKKKKPKSVGQRKSDHDSIPEYRAFRDANKALRVYLKEKNLSFKQALSDERFQKDGPVLAFREAQGTWFRRKNEITFVQEKETESQTLDQAPKKQAALAVQDDLGKRRLERTAFYPEPQPYRRGGSTSSGRGGAYKGPYHRNQSDFCEDSTQVQETPKASPAPRV